jgi:hypothetical protein
MEGMKPVMTALQILAAIENETRELILANAPSKCPIETDAEISPLLRKSEPHQSQKSKSKSVSCKRRKTFCNPKGSEFNER